MRKAPPAIIHLLRPFELLFSERAWEWTRILLVGAILAPGKRTVTAVLRVMGLSDERQFQNYHRVLNRAVWSPRAASRVLLRACEETQSSGLLDVARRTRHGQNPKGVARPPDQRPCLRRIGRADE